MGKFSHIISAEERQTLYDRMEYIIEEFSRNILAFVETFEGNYVTYQTKSSSIMFPLDSKTFDDIVMEIYRKEFGKSFEIRRNRQHLLDSICSSYPREKQKSECYNRVKFDTEKMEITYLLDDKNSIMRIDSQGFSVEKNKDVPFRTIVGMKDCVFPKREVSTDECNMLLDALFNLDYSSRLIMKVFLISCFFEIMHPVLMLIEEPGSGKTRISKVLKRITDNNRLELTYVSSKEDHQKTMLHCNRVVVANNLTKINSILNELICNNFDRAHYVGKELYTNDKAFIGKLDSILVITSTNTALIEQMELLERSLVITPKKIKEGQAEIEMDYFFAKNADVIMGGICTVISNTLAILKKKHLLMQTHNDRLIEFALLGKAITQALGYEEKEFDIAFRNIRQKGLLTMATNIPEIELLLSYFSEETNSQITGTPTNVYHVICDYHGIPDEKRQKNIALFTGVLNQNESLLERLGIEMMRKKKGKQKDLTIRRVFPLDDFGMIGASRDSENLFLKINIKDNRSGGSSVSNSQNPIPPFFTNPNLPNESIPAKSLFKDMDD